MRGCLAALLCGMLTAGLAAQTSNLKRLDRAASLLSQNQLVSAEEELLAILRNEPRDPQALNMLGVVRAEQGRNIEAENLFKEAVASAPRLIGAHINLGSLYFRQSRLDEAETQFEDALRIDNERRDARAKLLLVLRKYAEVTLGANPEKALAKLIKARILSDADPDVSFEFAVAALRLSLFDDAAAALSDATRSRPDDPRYVYAMGRAMLGKGELAQAVELFTKYVALRPEDASGFYGLGYAQSLLRNTTAAADGFRRSLALQPEQTESSLQLGLLAYADKDLESAAAFFQKVLARAPHHSEALLGMGQVLFSRKAYGSALEPLKQAIEADPSLAKAHYYLGRTLLAMNQQELGGRELEVAAKLESEQKQSRRVVLKLLPDR